MPDMPEQAIKALVRKYILAVADYGIYLLLRQVLGPMPLLAIAHIPLRHALIFGHRIISVFYKYYQYFTTKCIATNTIRGETVIQKASKKSFISVLRSRHG